MPVSRTRRLMATLTATLALASTVAAGAGSSPAEAAVPGPVKMLPQHVPQVSSGQLVLTADGTSVSNKSRMAVDLGLRTQLWHHRYVGPSVAQIVNDASGLCLRGGSSPGVTVRLAVCVDPNRIDLSVTEQRQFWKDQTRLHNGVVVHRWDNVQNGLPMAIRLSGTSAGVLDSQALTALPNQMFRNRLG